ncbi:uncharacterized protein A1O9_02922 [Exophiala aquamarina CBS 119918]|uniref:FMN hydroxy acid dehydrogenase domain-containing protein n=1 Tax=Exophiala aquamarina CBS 119918 TaxID=1182545 RepID=A0A072PNA7_9EURO|nr:uncharacterized protein A1O9_02922 [Exophiala aquamarina CBS 119918]KEF61356.1 hypothetical protein A1O9_02922 [Exophiala aquamarina CBS 119918]
MAVSTEDLESFQTIDDLERSALRILSPKALSYYPSATDDEITKVANHDIYRRVFLRPRLSLQESGTDIDLSTMFLGLKCGVPIHASPAAAARLAHADGEAGIASACSTFNAIYIISHNASMAPEDIIRAGRHDGHTIFGWQLYVLKDIKRTEATLTRIRQIPEIKFIVLTLDAPFPGKREADERFKMGELAASGGTQVLGTEAGLRWNETLEWLKNHTSLPIVLKGIQTFEDAHLSTLYPCVKGIIISNHGGRALDTTTTPLQVLLEIRKHCPHVLKHFDVLVDGGIKHGSDVVKALALGAKGVGVGRVPLYGLALAGRKGVQRALRILLNETIVAMRRLGVQRVQDLNAKHVNVTALDRLLYDGPIQWGNSSNTRSKL